jgi:predicted nucleic acid-binding protein
VESVTDDDLRRCADILDTHSDSRIDFVDASVMAVAERLGAYRIYTLDRRDLSIMRPRHVDAFELLP